MDELQKQLSEALIKVAKLDAEVSSQKSRADKAEAERDAAKAERDTARAARNDSETEAVARARSERDQAVAKYDAVQAQLDSEREQYKNHEKSINDRVRARVDLETAARNILGKDVEIAKMSDRDVRIAVIKKVDGADKEPDQSKSDDYVVARFDAATARAQNSETATLRLRGFGESHTDAQDETAARQRMMARGRDAWKS